MKAFPHATTLSRAESCSIPSKCMKNLREKVLGAYVKLSRRHFLRRVRRPRTARCLLKKVAQTKRRGLRVRAAFRSRPPSRAGFVLRFHDLAFLHFRRFGQVGSLVTVQTWQRTTGWWFYVISQFSCRWSTLIFISCCFWARGCFPAFPLRLALPGRLDSFFSRSA